MNKNIWQLKIQCCDASKKYEVDSTYKLKDFKINEHRSSNVYVESTSHFLLASQH